MLKITSSLVIPISEIKFIFTTSPGPGGQNVNKVATAVQLRFNLLESSSIPENIRKRLLIELSKKITKQGEIIIKAARFRTQERNKQDAIKRFIDLLKRAATPPKKRFKTKPPFASIQKRLKNKKVKSAKKLMRRVRHDD